MARERPARTLLLCLLTTLTIAAAQAAETQWIVHARAGNRELAKNHSGQAEKELSKALSYLEKTADVEARLDVSMNLAVALSNQHRFDEALELLQKIKKELDFVEINKKQLTLRLHRRTRDVYAAAGRLDSAIEEQKLAIDAMNKTFALESMPYIDELQNLQVLYLQRGRIEEANQVWQELEKCGLSVTPQLRGKLHTITSVRKNLLRQRSNDIALLFWKRVKLGQLDGITRDLGLQFLTYTGSPEDSPKIVERIQIASTTSRIECKLGNLEHAQRLLAQYEPPVNRLSTTFDLDGIVQARYELARSYQRRNQIEAAKQQLTALKKTLSRQSKIKDHSQTTGAWTKYFSEELGLPVEREKTDQPSTSY
ncbi:MAG: tetratricopeptide repeat protein [Candidatus Obscuribacterales bacterium]|nr:tetratricopeptide repeat protein [Candidatus Obscuribacterales bacterium]